MRIAFVSIPRFACAVEVLRSPQLARQPLIVGDAEQPKRVFDCSLQALRQGVRSGMAFRKATSLCPEAVVVPADPVIYRNLWERVLAALDDITPEIDDQDPGSAYLNVSGLERHYRNERALCQRIIDAIKDASGLAASVGVAGGKFTSFAASVGLAPSQLEIVPLGSETGFLAPLPASLLPVEPKIIDRLRILGLAQIGDVAAFTPQELQSQFGFEGRRLWQLANGIDEEPLHLKSRAESLSSSMSFEAAVAGIDVMVAVAKQLLSRLRSLLRGRAIRELVLQAELTSGRGWERRLVFREAVSESERLAFLLRSTLQNAPPPMAVRSLSLRLSGLTGETGKQLSLGERGRLQRQLEESIRQLKARYGYSPVFRCVDVEPWSVIPEERQILVESDV